LEGSATVRDLVEGLGEFTVSVYYRDGETSIRVDEVTFEKEIGGVNLRGTATNVEYSVDQGNFGGDLELIAELGQFGTASANATIANNTVERASLSYDSPEFRYPTDASSDPVFRGTVGGTITYNRGEITGDIRGTANLNIPGLPVGEEGLGLE